MPFWRPVEAACLSCGFDPYPLQVADENALLTQPAALARLQFRVELFNRAVEAQKFSHQILPGEAVRWLENIEEAVPPELREIVLRVRPYGRLVDVPAEARTLDEAIRGVSKPSAEAVSPKLQKSSDMMIAAMSIFGYGFDPAKKKSDIGRELADDIARLGLNLTPQVCSAHVKEACARLGIKTLPDADG